MCSLFTPIICLTCYVNQGTHCKCELGRDASKWTWCWKSCVQRELNAEGTMIKEEVQGYTLPFSESHVPQISLDVGTSLHGNDQHEVCWYGDELLIVLVCFCSEAYSILNSVQFHLLFGWCFWMKDHWAPAITTTAVYLNISSEILTVGTTISSQYECEDISIPQNIETF